MDHAATLVYLKGGFGRVHPNPASTQWPLPEGSESREARKEFVIKNAAEKSGENRWVGRKNRCVGKKGCEEESKKGEQVEKTYRKSLS